jgi:SET domain-containing protein
VVARAWHVLYVTIRAIDEGEELLVDYGREYWRKRPRPARLESAPPPR